jgi:hypothetical protein
MRVAPGDLAGFRAGLLGGHDPSVMPARRFIAACLIGNVMSSEHLMLSVAKTFIHPDT